MAINNDGLTRMPGIGWLYTGISAFSAAGVTVELAIPFKKIRGFVLTPVGTPNANEPLSVNETVSGGVITVPSTGTITVTRAAGTTADLAFGFVIFGE